MKTVQFQRKIMRKNEYAIRKVDLKFVMTVYYIKFVNKYFISFLWQIFYLLFTYIVSEKSFRKYVVSSFTELKFQLSSTAEKVDEIACQLSESNNPVENKSDDSSPNDFDLQRILPVKTLDALQEVEDKLTKTNYMKTMVSFLVQVGGKSLKDNVNSILIRTLSNEVAENFSWLGKKGKFIFGQLQLCSAIMSEFFKNILHYLY